MERKGANPNMDDHIANNLGWLVGEAMQL